jgi:hypothetical protein
MELTDSRMRVVQHDIKNLRPIAALAREKDGSRSDATVITARG